MESILAKRCVRIHGRILRYTKYGLWTRQIKVIGQRNPEEMPHISDLNYHEGRTLWVRRLCVYPRVLYSFFLLINTFTCFTTFRLCGNSFLQSRRARALSLTAGLVVRIWCSQCCNPTSISGREPKPCFKLLQARATRDQIYLYFFPDTRGKKTMPILYVIFMVKNSEYMRNHCNSCSPHT